MSSKIEIGCIFFKVTKLKSIWQMGRPEIARYFVT